MKKNPTDNNKDKNKDKNKDTEKDKKKKNPCWNRITGNAAAVHAGKGFLSTWALLLVCGLGTDSIQTILFFAASFRLYRSGKEVGEESEKESGGVKMGTWSRNTAFLLALLWTAGCADRVTRGLENRLFCVLLLAVCIAGLFLLLKEVLYQIFLKLEKIRLSAAVEKERPDIDKSGSAGRRLYLPPPAFLVCLICWVPYWMANFPAVMTVDSLNQYAQAVGIYGYSNHHPWIHTLLIQFCLWIGGLFTESSILGLALYTLLQMCLLAGCAAYLIKTMEQCNVRRRWRLITLGFYALLPVHGMFAVTIWKDILFAGIFLLFGLALFRMLRFGVDAKELFCYVLSGCLVCLLRSNGWYAFLASVPFLLFCFRDRMRSLLPATLLIIGGVMLIKGPVMKACGVTQPDLAEALSVPLQQIAGVVAQGREMSAQEKELLECVMDTGQIPEVYDQRCADNIKRLIRKGDPVYLEEHFEEYRRLYFTLGMQYPEVYYRAWVDLTSAYWYPETGQKLIFNEGIGENEFGLESSSLFRGGFYNKTKEIFFKLYEMIPGYGLLFSIGSYTWLVLVCAGYCLAFGRGRSCVVLLPSLALVGTLLLATPLNGELRYAYALLFSAPLYLLTAGMETTGKTER